MLRRLYYLGVLAAICLVVGSCTSRHTPPVTPHRSPTASSTFAFVVPDPTATSTASAIVFQSTPAYPSSQFPGATNPEVTQDTIDSTICVSGYTTKKRPPTSYTTPIKVALLAELHLSGTIYDYELDHKLAEEVGGDPRDPRNLWMEPLRGPFGALAKDQIEDRVHRDICSRKISLAAAQAIFLGNLWWTAQIP
jgi:hypothetical protein